MALLTTTSGCKVGWNYWSTREEAEADSAVQRAAGEAKWNRGYDFGYQSPGQLDELVLKSDLRAYGARAGEDDARYPVVAHEGDTVYIVTTP